MSRAKGVGGASGTKSSGTRRVSSSAEDNSKNFQPGTPAPQIQVARRRWVFQRAAKEQQPLGPKAAGYEDGTRQ